MYNKKTKTLTILNEEKFLKHFKEINANREDLIIPWEEYSENIEKVIVDEGIKALPLGFSNLPKLKEVKLPATLTELPNDAFRNCIALEKIKIPDSVVSISLGAFQNCKNLVKVSIGKEVKSISSDAFENCFSLKYIALSPDNVSFSIQDGVLYNKQLKKLVLVPPMSINAVTIPDTVETIGSFAFANCKNIKEIFIPKGVKEIFGGAFYNCTNLKSITFDKYSQCSRIFDEVFVSERHKDKYLYNYKVGVFKNCSSLTEITLPDNLKYIGYFTFDYCTSLQTINIGSKYKSILCEDVPIYQYDFEETFNLKAINISTKNKIYSSKDGILFNKSKTILYCYSRNKKSKSYNLPKQVKEIGMDSFINNRNLIRIDLSSVEKIGRNSFRNCEKLETVKWSKKLKTISDVAFADCKKLNSISSYGNNLKIDFAAFYNCLSLKSVTFKSGIRSIGDVAFMNCPLKKVTVPYSVKEIGNHALGYYVDNNTDKRQKNFIIYCKKKSAAYEYAKENKLKYKYY